MKFLIFVIFQLAIQPTWGTIKYQKKEPPVETNTIPEDPSYLVSAKEFVESSLKKHLLKKTMRDGFDKDVLVSSMENKEKVEKEICPHRVEKMIKNEEVTETRYAVTTLTEDYNLTKWDTVTKTVYFPITLMSRSTTTINVDPIYVTDTKVVLTQEFVTQAKIVTSDVPITSTQVEVKTYTATNTITTTETRPYWITLTEVATQWSISTVPVVSTQTEWISHVEDIDQHVYITTSLWVEAPQLELMTSTVSQPHYMTTTEYITKVKYQTVCQEPSA